MYIFYVERKRKCLTREKATKLTEILVLCGASLQNMKIFALGTEPLQPLTKQVPINIHVPIQSLATYLKPTKITETKSKTTIVL